MLQGSSKFQANYPARQNQVTRRWQKRARSCTRVAFGLVRWRSHNCLQTPPWYVGTISHATLFKGRQEEGRRWEGERRKGGIQVSCINVPQPCVWVQPQQNLSNYSTLHPPKPFSVTLPSFQSLSPPSLSSAASVCSSTPAAPPPPSSLLLQLTTCKKWD